MERLKTELSTAEVCDTLTMTYSNGLHTHTDIYKKEIGVSWNNYLLLYSITVLFFSFKKMLVVIHLISQSVR